VTAALEPLLPFNIGYLKAGGLPQLAVIPGGEWHGPAQF
jgi:hypothetical protein